MVSYLFVKENMQIRLALKKKVLGEEKISGICYNSSILKVHRILCVPSWVAKIFSWTLEPIFSSAEPTNEIRVGMGATVDIQRQQRMELLDRQIMMSQVAQMRRQRQQQLSITFQLNCYITVVLKCDCYDDVQFGNSPSCVADMPCSENISYPSMNFTEPVEVSRYLFEGFLPVSGVAIRPALRLDCWEQGLGTLQGSAGGPSNLRYSASP
ncbi:UNVERIFIED_CONTAM: hypothetical protein H355_000946 [Colinus virginianus]|nr:hypothetical protein H355_000946 [Colinus virginianus]